MSASSYYASGFGNFDDEFYQYQASADGEHQSHAQPIPYFEGVTQPIDQIFDESYVVGSNQFQFEGDTYPYQDSMTGPPSATFTESPVEDFQYIDFGQSYMPEPQASLNMPVSPVGVLDGFYDNSVRVADASNAASTSSASKDQRAAQKSSSKKPPHSRHHSGNAPSSHKASPRPASSAAEPSSNVNSRSAKKSQGPPKERLTVFPSNSGPQMRRKSRSAFSEEGKKKVEAVRRVGACIECRFRKRTCETNQPCQGCIKRTGSAKMAAQICIRESPFTDLSVTEFYGSASRTRVVDFNVDFTSAKGRRRIFTIDGKGPSSRPIHVIVLEVKTSALSPQTIDEITRVQRQTSRRAIENNNRTHSPKSIMILDPDHLSALDLEKWAVEYSYKFTQAHNKNALAYLLAIQYVERGLPHSSLVANMVKLISLNYVLFHDIKVTPDASNSDGDWRTLRAQIDTRLFHYLYRAEKFVYRSLHKIIFLSSGRLTRDAAFPVCLVLWLLVRVQSMRASYFANLRPKSSTNPIVSSSGKATTSPSHQYHALNLLVATFGALFRSSLPLLLNFDDSFNKDLLGNDDELLTLGKRLKGIMLWFRTNGYPKFHRQSLSHSEEHTRKICELIRN